MKNNEISEIFYRIAEILELQEVQWKPQAYVKAAYSIENLGKDIEEIYKKGGIKALEEIPGVGEKLAEKIEEYLKTGKIKEYEHLKKQIPKEFLEVLDIPGVGAKKAKILYQKLKIKNLKDLEKAAKEGRIHKLVGFKEKSEENILEGIEFLKERKSNKEFLLGYVLPIAREIKQQLEKLGCVQRVDLAGSIRRMKKTVHDIDMLVITSDPKKTMDYFANLKQVKKIIVKGEKRTSILTNENIQIDLRTFEKENYGAALQYFTGSRQHSISLRQLAIKKKLKINEYGIFKNKKRLDVNTEEKFYKILGLNYIPPELRENTGEIEYAKKSKFPKLLELKDIKGDLHMHTNWSDGINSLEEIVAEAQKMGYEYVVISDHAGNMKIANAMDEKRILKQIKEIDKIQKKFKIKILKGVELDILKDGSLSLPDKILKQLDIILGSIHSGFKMSEKDMTARVLKAMDNPYLNIISHPTGRMINSRKPFAIDLNKIFEKAVKNNIALEINSFPNRLDLEDVYIKQAKAKGVKFAISTDSHAKENLQFIELGVGQARRAWCEPKDILNTCKLNELMKFLKRK